MARISDYDYRPYVYWRGGPPAGIEGFGARLKQAREGAGLTQTALAERAGGSVSTLVKLETGHNRPSYRTALMLAAALAINADWLITGDGQP